MCTATIPLDSYSTTQCEIEGDHPGRDHENSAWGPKVTWPNREPVTA